MSYRPCANGDGLAAAPGEVICTSCLGTPQDMVPELADLPTPEDFQAQALAVIPEGIDPNTPTGKARKRPSRAKPKLDDAPTGPPLSPAEKLEAAKRELAETIMPLLELFFKDNPPQAGLWFLRSASMLALDTLGGAVKELADDGETEAPAALEALACAMGCVRFSTQGLVALEVLPPEALSSLEEALR